MRNTALGVLGLGIVLALSLLVGVREVASALHRADPTALFRYLILALLLRTGLSVRWLALSRATGVPGPFRGFFFARLAGDAVSSLVPWARVAGDPVRVVLLTAEGAAATAVSAAVVMDRTLELIGNSICAITYVTVFLMAVSGESMRPSGIVLLAVLALSLASLLLWLAMLHSGRPPFTRLLQSLRCRSCAVRWAPAVQAVEDQLVVLLRRYPSTLLLGLIATLLIEALFILQFHELLAGFGVRLPLATLLMTIVVTGLAQTCPTPGGLGAMEGAQVTLLAVVAGEPALGLTVGIVLRLDELLWTAVGLAAMTVRGLKIRHVLRGVPASAS